MLIKILRNLPSFRSFLKIVQENITQLRDPEIAGNPSARGLILHTIKGNCMIFNMKKQANLLHEIEEKLSFEPVDSDFIESIFVNFLSKHREILNLNWESLSDFDCVVKKSNFSALRYDLMGLKSIQEIPACYDGWLNHVTAISVKELLGPIAEDINNLAKKTGRLVHFELTGSDCKIYSDEERNLVKTLVHLVRNSIFHGIEQDRDAVNNPF